MAGCVFSIIPRSRTPFNLWKIYRNLSFIQVPISRNMSPTTAKGPLRQDYDKCTIGCRFGKASFPPIYISLSTTIHFWETIKSRGIQTQTDPTDNSAGEEAASHEFSSDDSKSVSNSVEVLESSASDNSVEYKALSNLKTSKRHDLAMVFTCKVCETRSVKTVCRESYDKGVVVVRCGGCSNLHLIADRLGWFGEPGSVEDLLAARGEEVRKGSIDSLNLTAEDLAGLRSS